MENDQRQTLGDIRKTRVLKAPIAKVWKAVATAEGIASWWMPNDFEPVVGHEFHLDAGPYGKSPCKITAIEPPHKVAFDWGKDWTLTFELKELTDGQTEFTLIHGGWDEDQATEFGEPHVVVRERMSQGWAGIVEKMAGLIEG